MVSKGHSELISSGEHGTQTPDAPTPCVIMQSAAMISTL